MSSGFIDFLERKIIWKTPERAIGLYRRVGPGVIAALRLANLRKTLRLAGEKAPFYSKLFKDQPFDLKKVSSPADLGEIYTRPEDLQREAPENFLCGNPQTAFETTGTVSRNPKRVFFSYREIEDAGRVGAAGLWQLGLRPDDRVASSFDYSFWVSGPTLKASLKEMGVFHVEAGRIDPEEFYERVKPYGCRVIVADPGWLVRLSEIAAKSGSWPLKFMIAGGENLAENSRRFIEEVWRCKVLLSYGQTEAFGMIGIECHEQKGYHVNDMDLWVEIADADREGYGELVYTTLRRSVMPLVRYRSGDVTRLITEPCACGTPSPRLAKLKGRMDQMVVTAVGNIASWMMESSLETLKIPLRDWQLGVDRKGIRDYLELRVETAPGISLEGLKVEVLDAMKHKMPVAFGGIHQGLAEFELKIVPVGTLKGTARKTKRIVDERSFE